MSKQKGLFTEDFRLSELSAHGDPLLKLNTLIPWESFRFKLNRIFKKEAKTPGGRPPYDYVMMFKILILQRFYNLSDSQMQYQILDRLSFMRFLGLTLDDRVPDEKTIWHFREQLVKSEKLDQLFELFRSHLIQQGVIVESGTIVDASFVEAPRQRNNREENDQIKNDKVPEEWSENTSIVKKMSMLDGRQRVVNGITDTKIISRSTVNRNLSGPTILPPPLFMIHRP